MFKKVQVLTIVVCGLQFAILGCRTPDPAVALLESELRWMEDNLYTLDDQLDRCCEQLQSAQRNNVALRAQLATTYRQQGSMKPGDSPSGNSQGSTGSASDGGPFDEELGEDDDLLRGLTAPEVEYGDADAAPNVKGEAEEELPEGVEMQGVPDEDEIRKAVPDSGEPLTDPFEDAANAKADQVTRIQLNRQLTGGYDFDGQPGNEGVIVVLEPQNARKKYLAQTGEVTVEVRNPSKPGPAGQVAKWRFDAVEITGRMQETLLGRGIHLKLPWPNGFPDAEKLKLVVGFDTQEGRHLVAEKDIRVKLPESPTVMARTADQVPSDDATWQPGRAASVPPLLEWNPDRF